MFTFAPFFSHLFCLFLHLEERKPKTVKVEKQEEEVKSWDRQK